MCVSEVTCEVIANDMLTHLADWQLDLKLLVGQAYYGVGGRPGRHLWGALNAFVGAIGAEPVKYKGA